MNNTPTPSKNETAVRLYDEAQVFEGSRPSGLLIQGGDEILRLERELAAVTEQRDRLAEALELFLNRVRYNSVFMDGEPRGGTFDYRSHGFDAEVKQAYQALADVKGGADE